MIALLKILLLLPAAFAEILVDGKELGIPSQPCPNKLVPKKVVQLPLPKGRPITKYMRTDGNTVILTMAKGDNAMFSINSEGVVKSLENNFKDEATLDSCGRFIISPNHEDGMHYYRVSDVLKNQKQAKPVLVHPMNDFYQSASGHCGQNANEVTVMVHHMLQSSTLAIDDEGKMKQKSAEFYCPNFYDQRTRDLIQKLVPDLALYYRVKRAMFEESKVGQKQNGEIIHDWAKWGQNPKNAVRFGISSNDLEKLVGSYKILQDLDTNHGVAEPMLAPVPGVFAGVTKAEGKDPTLKVFKRNGNQCDQIADLGKMGGKPTFSHQVSKDGIPTYVAFEETSNFRGALVHLSKVNNTEDSMLAFRSEDHGSIVSYPAFTRSGDFAVMNQHGELMFFDADKIVSLKGCVDITRRKATSVMGASSPTAETNGDQEDQSSSAR